MAPSLYNSADTITTTAHGRLTIGLIKKKVEKKV